MGEIKTALIILKGEKPNLKMVKNLQQNTDYIICADGAIQFCEEINLIPNLVIGDFDSIPEKSINKLQKVEYLKVNDQDTTDGEKALLYCLNHGFNHVNIIGGFGGRVDHSLYNIELLKKFYKRGLKINSYSATERVFITRERAQFEEETGTRLSFFPIFGKVNQLFSRGLKWTLDGATLEFGLASSISNEICSSPAEITFQDNELLIVLEQNIV